MKKAKKVTDATFIRRINRGIKFLDKRYGKKWRKKIDLDELLMSNGGYCVLGQTDGEYDLHRERLGLIQQDCKNLGFYISEEEEVLDPICWDTLTHLWKKKLRDTEEES